MASNVTHLQALHWAHAKSKFGPWYTKTITWPALVKQLTHQQYVRRLAVSGGEYEAMGKADREKLKDGGGFVLGQLKGETRRADEVLSRSGVALDIDKADISWNDLVSLVGSAIGDDSTASEALGVGRRGLEYLLYPSASHGYSGTTSARLIIPMHDAVPPETYSPICRRIMDWINIDLFDTSAAQANRFFYMPAIVHDASWESVHHKGSFLNGEHLLDATFDDWNDVNQWPVSKAEASMPGGLKARGADGTLKKKRPEDIPGFVGSVCRALTMHEVLSEFLDDKWGEGSVGDDNVVSYLGGSSVNGGKIFEDAFLYSFHDSDPYNGPSHGALNAFQAVQFHKFGHLDAHRDAVGTQASHKAAEAFFRQDRRVLEQLAIDAGEHSDNACEGFEPVDLGADAGSSDDESWDDIFDETAGNAGSGAEAGTQEETDDWDDLFSESQPAKKPDPWHVPLNRCGPGRAKAYSKDELPPVLSTSQGQQLGCVENAIRALSRAKGTSGKIRWNELKSVAVAIEDLSDHTNTGEHIEVPVKDPVNGTVLDDFQMSNIRLYLASREKVSFSSATLREAVDHVARRGTYSPVASWLDAQRWDGVPRVERLLIDVFGVHDTPYNRAVADLFMKACVARAFNPGCKVDEVLVLVGAEGTYKSTFCKALCPFEEWFSDTMPPITGDARAAIEAMQGSWIIELSELSSMKTANRQHVKAFLSRTRDKARMAYAHTTVDVPRSSVMIATTNEQEFLGGDDGNRRFLPVPIWQSADIAYLRKNIALLWAEALARWLTFPDLKLPDCVISDAREQQQMRLLEKSDYESPIEQYLAAKPTHGDWIAGVETGVTEGFEGEGELPETRQFVCAAELIDKALANHPNRNNIPLLRHEIRAAMRRAGGWATGNQHTEKVVGKSYRPRFGSYGKQRTWYFNEAATTDDEVIAFCEGRVN